ncbi:MULTISPECIES: hypothetical protein [unclassified Mucilaginibacter]|uniref:hypothetical protein n=1 Tax=unclassified Mucilaginibacter TaxID=2617802 RepID=UPI002AC931C8|nr:MULTISPECIES: hypothetical protein [unclassified Mucilaginibacter]MEB0263219.1 hypothetical protein [Mucilaginibacter sp. 10I4]MEB0278689.1 hypothetical protein [Mucilaginibacter sp. 10B2]MEB0299399.1 hypothetical protein [Mucilaginibacter sp. 5C4]WPX23359.1 hypothetical protein RHM67_18955 [Mucilaginibacter sp. 5C4]
MKKSLLFIALFFCASQLMAQKATIAPFDSTFGSKVLQPFKVDSTWRVKPPALSTDQFFKQEDVDVSKLKLENQKPLLIAAEGYNMPILNLNNISKTPIVVLEGYSKMPVAGKGMTKAQKTTLVHP